MTMVSVQRERAICPGCGKPIDPDHEGWVTIVPTAYVNRLNEDDIPRTPWHWSCWEAERPTRGE